MATYDAPADDDYVSLAQLQRLSPTLQSLSLIRCHTLLSDTFDLICSFPLLEDLRPICFGLDGGYYDINVWNTTASPKFTGSLHLTGEVGSITLGLLNLPGGFHFSKIEVSCPDCHAESMMGLVSECSDTLECLSVDLEFFSRAFCSALTGASRQCPVSSRPLYGYKTQRSGISVREAKDSMDFHNTPIRSAQNPSTDQHRLMLHIHCN